MSTITSATSARQFTTCGMEIPAFAIRLAETCPNTSAEDAWHEFGEFSDCFKEANGFRPRHECLIPSTLAELREECNNLIDQANREWEEEQARKKAELEAYSRRVQARKKEHRRLSTYAIGDLFPNL